MARILLLLPVLTLFVFLRLLYRRYSHDRKHWDIPFRDDHERPPGESLRLKLEELNDKLMERFMFLMLSAVIPFMLITFTVPAVTAVAVTGVILLFQLHEARHIWRLIPEYRNHRIGFEGERLTAQYLQPLLCQGHFVYHDVPMGEYNVDHVVVGPNGVFAIETKSRRKRRSAGTERARVKYDGKSLKYPELDPETHGLDAAVTRAKGLQDWLSSAVGESVPVQPVLALPGWYVERNGRSTLPVMNPKTIPNFISKAETRPLSEQRIRQIRHQLFEKSKVEPKR